MKKYDMDYAEGLMKESGMRYVTCIPREPLPEGVVLVHNHIAPQRVLGRNGFRAWTQTRDDSLVQCHCDWAGVNLHGMAHYCVILPLLLVR